MGTINTKKNRPFTQCVAIILFILCGLSHAASFDCTKASTDIEVTVCNDPELSEADSVLGTTYKRAIASNPAARERQIAWLQNVRSSCHDKNCLLQAYRQQTSALTINFLTPSVPIPSQSETTDQETSTSPVVGESKQSAIKYIPTEPEPPQQVIQPSSAQVEVPERPVAESQTVGHVQQEEGSSNLTMVYIIGAAMIGFFVWNKFIRLRCPECKSAKIETVSINEVDRWRGNKKVTETNTRGSKTRYVSTTYVKNQYRYQCVDCQSHWIEVKKEEL